MFQELATLAYEPRRSDFFRNELFKALPVSDIPASLVDVGGRSFLVYPNYERILDYNCAHLYALSVGMLADRLQ